MTVCSNRERMEQRKADYVRKRSGDYSGALPHAAAGGEETTSEPLNLCPLTVPFVCLCAFRLSRDPASLHSALPPCLFRVLFFLSELSFS